MLTFTGRLLQHHPAAVELHFGVLGHVLHAERRWSDLVDHTRGSTEIGVYNISKAADFQLARNLAQELGPHNIRVNCIAPGLVKTDFARALWEGPYGEERIKATPLRRFGEPDDIAGAAVFLAGRAGAWMTGQTIIVDGGVTS